MASSEHKRVKRRARYSEEYKQEAVALSDKLGVPAAARDLGLHSSQLYGWRRQQRHRADERRVEQAQAAEIARLKRQLADQAEELAILKKASAYFAKHQK